MSLGYATERNLTYRVRRWSDLVSYTTPPVSYNLNPSGNFSNTGTLQWKKIANAGWNSNIFSNIGLPSGTMECKSLSMSYGWMCGVSTQNTTTGYPGITWGISVQAGGTLEVYNAGSSGGQIAGGYTNTSVIKMVWTTTDINYYVDNVLKKTYARTAGNLYLNFCFNDVNSEAKIITFSP